MAALDASPTVVAPQPQIRQAALTETAQPPPRQPVTAPAQEQQQPNHDLDQQQAPAGGEEEVIVEEEPIKRLQTETDTYTEII